MYMTPSEAATRLQNRYSITSTPLIGDVAMAGEDLRDRAPFVEGVDLDGDLPESLKDWVALRAHVLTEDEPGAVVEDSMSPFTRKYATPEHSQNQKRLERLLKPYLAVRGRVG